MSTRATYEFKSPQATITFYIHYDGYPEGAAVYFSKALSLIEHMGLPEAFVRANSEAEFTHGHEAHGDTEYRYDVWIPSLGKNFVLNVSHRNMLTGEWGIVWSGELARFVEIFSSHDE